MTRQVGNLYSFKKRRVETIDPCNPHRREGGDYWQNLTIKTNSPNDVGFFIASSDLSINY